MTKFNPNLGVSYFLITGVLLVTIFLSGRCWSYQNTFGLPNMALRDKCLTIWALAGLLLALSQVVFIWIAFRAQPSKARTVILSIALVIAVMIALFVFVLANMPS